MLMYMIYALAAIRVGAVVFSGTGDSREESIYCQKVSTRIDFDFSGRLIISDSQSMDWCPPFKTFELLLSEEVRKELELVPKQITEIESLLRRFQERRNDLAKKQQSGGSVSEEYQKECLSLKRDIDSVLLAFQAKRIEELYWQVTLRRSGVEPLINEQLRLSGRQLTKEQRDEIERTVKQAVDKWAGEVKGRCLSILNEFKKRIPDQFQEELAARIAGNPDYANLDVLDITSQRFLEKLESSNDGNGQDRTPEYRLTQAEYNVLEFDGNWKYVVRTRPLDAALLSWIVDPEKSQLVDLDLTGLQMDQLSMLTLEIRTRIDENNEAVNEMFDRGSDDKSIRTFLDERNKDLNDFAKQRFFDEVLLPHQHKLLGKRLDRLETAKCGPFALNLDDVRISDTQKRQLIESVNELRDAILSIKDEAAGFERMLLTRIDKVDNSAMLRTHDMIGRESKRLGFSWLMFLKVHHISSR